MPSVTLANAPLAPPQETEKGDFSRTHHYRLSFDDFLSFLRRSPDICLNDRRSRASRFEKVKERERERESESSIFSSIYYRVRLEISPTSGTSIRFHSSARPRIITINGLISNLSIVSADDVYFPPGTCGGCLAGWLRRGRDGLSERKFSFTSQPL